MTDPILRCPECGSVAIRCIPVEDVIWSVEPDPTYGVRPSAAIIDSRETWRYYCRDCTHEPEDPWDFVRI